MRHIMYNPLLKISDTSRYPGVQLMASESGTDHTTHLALMAVHIIRDMLIFVKQYQDYNELSLDLAGLTLKALFYDHTINGYQIGSITKEAKYYDYEVKTRLNLPFLYTVWQNLKDDTIESQILKLADFLTVLKKCIDEIQTLGNKEMMPIAVELKDHLLYYRDKTSKQTIRPGVKSYFLDAYTKSIAILDEILPQSEKTETQQKPLPEQLLSTDSPPPVDTSPRAVLGD